MTLCTTRSHPGVLFLTVIAAFGFPLWAQTDKTMILRLTSTAPRIDGEIDPVWAEADSVSDFEQSEPFYGKPPTERTVVRLLGTDEALYCLMVCHHEKAPIQDIAGVFDQASGDGVSLMIDTFHDKQTAYRFWVSASGAQSDSRMVDDGRNRDYSWDGVWFAQSRVHSWGYVIEMEIPFKSIRYNGELKEWGLDVHRWIASAKEELYWCKHKQAESQRISRFGRLILNGARPVVTGLNLEVYPVALARAVYSDAGKYRVEADAGIDIFYNPSEKLTFQLTGNPDFAQIEADPFEFNISRYETYFSELRPFFTTGKEVFMASGKEQNSGFYNPLELFYSRRIGRVLGDGSLVPLNVGAKTFGRLGTWEYGGFLARTGGADFEDDDGILQHEPAATFTSARVKKQILENSSIGMLFVGKHTPGRIDGVIDIDGAFRSPSYQLAYQLARSINNGKGDFGGSAGFRSFTKDLGVLVRTRIIGNEFDVNQVGYVPWRGTANLTAIAGPMWYFDEGAVSSIFQYSGFMVTYEHADLHTDWSGALGLNMQFRSNWGFEVTLVAGENKDLGHTYTTYECDLSSWFSLSPRWNANAWGGIARSYNFSRNYVGLYSWFGSYAEWKALDILELGTTYEMYIEGNPEGRVEDITYNARPFVSLTPVNNLNLRLYVDNLFVQSSDQMERIIVGFLFSYNFLPKSWIYLALNEVRERRDVLNAAQVPIGRRMETADRVGVMKVKYLYYL
jgi:hypothetical protein